MRSPRIPSRFRAPLVALLAMVFVARTRADAAADANGEWKPITTAHNPGSRSEVGAAYDPVGNRMLIFGGILSGATQNDVWQLNLTGTPDWTQVSTSGSPPPHRTDATAVYDPLHNQLVVFGGDSASTKYGDVWVLSLGGSPTWRKVDDKLANFVCTNATSWSKPCPRNGHGAAWNSHLGTMWVTCGDACFERNDTWSAAVTDTSSTWTSLAGNPKCDDFYYSASLPDLRSEHSMIYDARNQNVVVFGGDYLGDPVAESNAWQSSTSGTTWTELSATTIGPSRVNHTAVYDSVRARMIVFGGCDIDSVIALDLTPGNTPSWSWLHACGTSPGTIANHAAIFDANADRMIVFTTTGTTYSLDFESHGPSAISDLTAKSFAGSSVYLRWTSPSDDGASGKAASYDLRYSTAEITDANFGSATQVSGEPTPATAGQKDSLNVTGLSQGTDYWFAIQSTDACGNVSALSNVFSICWLTNPLRLCDDGGLHSTPVRNEPAAAPLALGIGDVRPNPAHGAIDVAFTLPRAGAARLDLIDVAGRLVRREEVGAMGAGSHSLRFGDDAPLAPGFLVVRLTQGGTTVTRSVVVVR